MKFSEMTSHQSARAVPSRTRGKWVVRRPMPWPRYGKASRMRESRRGAVGRPRVPETSVLRRLLDLAALLGAVVLAHLHDALALAAVLARAGVAGAGARARALARVHALAHHLVAAGLLRVLFRHGRAAQDEAGRRGRDQHAFRLPHRIPPLVRCTKLARR